MKIVTTVKDLRAQVAAWRAGGQSVALVPTMGALHDGHLSLAELARAKADRVAVTIFVNPAQFAPHEDFDRYPRDLDRDAAMLAPLADLIFAPDREEIYPQGFSTRIEVGGPSQGLETDFRPHFFAGVATIVAKLLIAAMPDVAVFGEKDWQQLQVIERLTLDLGLPIAIVGAPIVREADGLAMSSRNAYLTPAQRQVAGRMNVILKTMRDPEAAKRALLDAGFDSVDYVAIRDGRILAAARIGTTRLIDNMAV